MADEEAPIVHEENSSPSIKSENEIKQKILADAKNAAAKETLANNTELVDIISKLKSNKDRFIPFELPSRGLLNPELNGENRVWVKPMGGKEERILLTPRLMRTGEAMNGVFAGCVKDINPQNLTSSDRLFLMYVIRSLTYGTIYEYEITCPACSNLSKEDADLDELPVNYLEEEKVEPVTDEFPISGLSFVYRYERGSDEQKIQKETQSRRKMFMGDQADTTFDRRALMLLKQIDKFDQSSAVEQIWNNLEAGDRAHFRNLINNPPFGIDTNINHVCPNCGHEYEAGLPITVDFFFPRKIQKKS